MFSLAERSLYVADLNLWIDSLRPRTRCYVSHGHSDHAREHDTIVTTPANAAICRSRFALGRAEARRAAGLRLRGTRIQRALAARASTRSRCFRPDTSWAARN